MLILRVIITLWRHKFVVYLILSAPGILSFLISLAEIGHLLDCVWVSGTITIRPFKRFLPGRQVVSSQACADEHSTEYLSVPLPICKVPSLCNSLLLCSDLQIGATLVTLAYLGLPLPSCLGTPPVISWDSYKTQPV